MSHRTTDYAALLRAQGYRVTPQRQLILDAVCDGKGHTTVEEIIQRVQANAPAISPATVYRTLDFFCELGLIVCSNMGGRQVIYEIAGEQPHHHLVCRECGAVEDLAHTQVQDFYDDVKQTRGFTVEMSHLMLFGVCQDCQ